MLSLVSLAHKVLWQRPCPWTSERSSWRGRAVSHTSAWGPCAEAVHSSQLRMVAACVCVWSMSNTALPPVRAPSPPLPAASASITQAHHSLLLRKAMKGLHSICQQIWKTQQWPQDWKRSVFIPIPKKGNAEECSNYCTI